MKIELASIVDKVKLLKEKPYKTFISKFGDLVSQIEYSVVLRGPYRLVLDSNIVMRLESLRQGNIAEGVLAVLLAFLFVKRLPFHVDLVIRPVVFYEFLRRRNVKNLKEHWHEIKALKFLVEDSLNVTLFFDGIETYEGASHYLEIIQRDSEVIAKTLREYQGADWRFDFVRSHGGFSGYPARNGEFMVVPPFFAAEGLYEKIELKYFHEPAARMFFVQYIERYLAECVYNDQTIIKRYPNDSDYLLTKVLRLTAKGNLEGLGDVDVLTTCNLQSQFYAQANGRYAPASIGMSIDDKLSKALRYYSSLNITSRQLGGALDDETLEQQKAALESFTEDSRRFGEGEKRVASTRRILCEYIDELIELGTFDRSLSQQHPD